VRHLTGYRFSPEHPRSQHLQMPQTLATVFEAAPHLSAGYSPIWF
jgi:hypothetical protein